MEVRPYDSSLRAQWTGLFLTYFIDDLRIMDSDPRVTPEVLREKLCPFILKEVEQGTVSLDLAVTGGAPVGFSAYQIDRPDSDWCKRPGWGLIREFAVSGAFRRRGIGRALAAHTEGRLAEMGAARVYLTSSGEGAPFWLACGFRDTGERDGKNGNLIFEKEIGGRA